LADWRVIKEQLLDNEYAVELIRYRHYETEFTDSIIYLGMVISNKTRKAPKVVRLPQSNLFESRYFKFYKNSIKYKVDDKWSYKSLWEPFESIIPKDATIYLSAEGIYNQINLEAIKREEGDYVLDRNKFVLVSNTKDLIHKTLENTTDDKKEKPIKKREAILIGNPAFYDIREKGDSTYITSVDSIYAEEHHKVFLTITDNKTATYRDEIRICSKDKILADEEDQIYITTEDKLFAHYDDRIYITTEDSVKKFNIPITTEDSIIATISDSVFITTSDSIIAKKYHLRYIKDEDNVWAEKRHGKKITLSDSVIAKRHHQVYLSSADKIVNQNIYSKLTIPQLKGAEKEIYKVNIPISDKLKTSYYVFDAATESLVKKIKDPFIFHIATHGFWSENAQNGDKMKNPLLKTGLILKHGGDIIDHNSIFNYNKEEGVLTAYEAMGLNFNETELVVLSACETGLGDIKGGEVYGLQRSFLVAGAKSIIMSLFKVSDDATQKLMQYFYQYWLKEGMGKREAFVAAKKELRKEYKEPIYWGAFIMIGI